MAQNSKMRSILRLWTLLYFFILLLVFAESDNFSLNKNRKLDKRENSNPMEQIRASLHVENERKIKLPKGTHAELAWQYQYLTGNIIHNSITSPMPTIEQIKTAKNFVVRVQYNVHSSAAELKKFQKSAFGIEVMTMSGGSLGFESSQTSSSQKQSISSIMVVFVDATTNFKSLHADCSIFSDLKQVYRILGTHLVTKLYYGHSIKIMFQVFFASEADQKAWVTTVSAAVPLGKVTIAASFSKIEDNIRNFQSSSKNFYTITTVPLTRHSVMQTFEELGNVFDSVNGNEGNLIEMDVTEINHVVHACTAENLIPQGTVEPALLGKFLAVVYKCEENLEIFEELQQKIPKAPEVVPDIHHLRLNNTYLEMTDFCTNVTLRINDVFDIRYTEDALSLSENLISFLKQPRLTNMTFYSNLLASIDKALLDKQQKPTATPKEDIQYGFKNEPAVEWLLKWF